MANKLISIDDGRRDVRVSDLMARPEIIPTRAIDLLRNEFPAEDILTDGGTANTLEFEFTQNANRYMDSDPEVIAEFAEFPTVAPSHGDKILGRATKVGYRMVFSREMKDFNQVQQVNKTITRAVNTFKRYNEKQLWEALLAAPIPEIAAGVPWNQQGSDPRYDIALAMETVSSGNAVYDENIEESWDPDMIVLNKALTPTLVANDKFNAIFDKDGTNSENIRYTGKLPKKPMGLDALGVRFLAKDRVLVLQKGAPGFFKDPRRLEATPLRADDEWGGDTETFSSRISQIRFIGVDEPFSACWITGVTA